MPKVIRKSGGWIVAALLLLCASVTASAYPDQPIKVIVTFPPGGSTDIVIRALQLVVADALRQPLVIENRSGAGGNIGIAAVAHRSRMDTRSELRPPVSSRSIRTSTLRCRSTR